MHLFNESLPARTIISRARFSGGSTRGSLLFLCLLTFQYSHSLCLRFCLKFSPLYILIADTISIVAGNLSCFAYVYRLFLWFVHMRAVYLLRHRATIFPLQRERKRARVKIERKRDLNGN